MAWWAPKAIPRTLLNPLTDRVALTKALGDLAAYNMITLTSEAITVHRLVQAVARTPDTPTIPPPRQEPDIAAGRAQAVDLLNQACPDTTDDPAQWPTWRRPDAPH